MGLGRQLPPGDAMTPAALLLLAAPWVLYALAWAGAITTAITERRP